MRNLLFVSVLLFISFGLLSQNKKEFENNGISINFITTKLGEIVDNKIEILKDMQISGVFVFLPEKKSIVIRHENGNDELLKVITVQNTKDNNYIFTCDKQRVLFLSTNTKLITYSIEGNSVLFLFPIKNEDVELLNIINSKF